MAHRRKKKQYEHRRQVGCLTHYDAERGIGTITPDNNGQTVFVTLRKFNEAALVPKVGMRIRYDIYVQRGMGVRARNIGFISSPEPYKSGIISWFNRKNHYGWVKPCGDTNESFFLHASTLRKSGIDMSDIEVGDPILFQVGPGINNHKQQVIHVRLP